MKHAVVFAHPNPQSFTATMAQAWADAARQHGAEVIVRDLYTLDFDPRLARDELPGDQGATPRADVAAERRLLAEVEVIVLVYPFWFNAPPAILKGYVDRVFGMGFGYAAGAGGAEPLLGGRKLISITSSGAPLAWVRDTGAWRALRLLFDAHIGEVCGLEVLDHRHFGEITSGIREDAVRDCVRDVAALFRSHFARATSPH